MFLVKEDLGVAIYGYQLEQITEGKDDIVMIAMAAAQEEARGYLTANNNKQYLDGRFVYDTKAIFSATGNDRHPLILLHCITLAKWHIVQLCNVDIIYEQVKERYDRATKWFLKLVEGDANLDTLPIIDLSEDTTKQPFAFGSRAKFNHDY